jgi:hypothetical protein
MALDAGNSGYSVHLVVQRYRTCKLLLEDEGRWASIESPGMLCTFRLPRRPMQRRSTRPPKQY